ncbi:alpha,alpha-trehalose-phosphate synthase (UDP-forming) [Cuniculiplasma divulgatum]|uniref:Trehalose-6-phosphate synthase n=1 Tax=Cuniculiplasma divulgatum TaxID=1673428 RepID=A0A1N5VV21_9ARCH|nr:trehalose-6-phosphate synthase [Cuniculiplasma divulgatum]MCL4319754.1 trehalose-6-phosphate synthase [Candidatus Thermoplasmatota archaeon]SIM76912.1 trehalose-6-phosphate synthase [Cuniculiplasma divulgatum]
MSVIMVTSRGPYSYEKKNNRIIKQENVGGVATGLKKIIERDRGTWICWGDGNADHLYQDENNGLYRIKRILLNPREKKGFYDDYSNSTLWPLFHYFREKIEHDSIAYGYYRHVNRKFAEVIKDTASSEDVIWVHDYQLSLVPKYLRDMGVKNKLLFTWHIPWVSSEFYTILPEREDIVKSISMCNSITFHTQKYRTNFRHSYERVVGYDKELERRTFTFPLGIDYQSFSHEQIESGKRPFEDKKIIFSIDRLDYTKGLVERVNAIEMFIKKYPEFKEKFVYLMMVTPSRIGVEEYEKLKEKLEMNVGRINGLYGNLNWVPIVYMYRKINSDILKTYYSWGDIALITPMKDGLNLVSMEYVAVSKKGVLILSEFAGISEYLRGAIKTNPNSDDDVSEKIAMAMRMPDSEILRRLRSMKDFLRKHDDKWWANRILGTLVKN